MVMCTMEILKSYILKETLPLSVICPSFLICSNNEEFVQNAALNSSISLLLSVAMVLIPWWLAGVQISQPTFACSSLAVGIQLCEKDAVIFQISCQQCSGRLPVIRIFLNFENALWQRKRRWKKSRQIILSREVPACFFVFVFGARST